MTRLCPLLYNMFMEHKRWSDSELMVLHNKYPHGGAKEVMQYIPRTRTSINHKASRLGITMHKIERQKLNRRLGSFTAKRYSGKGPLNPNWKGGISKNSYRYKLRMKEKYPEKYKCRSICRQAIRSGKLERKSCEVCGDQKSEAHHEDYTKPFTVIWLCRFHHQERYSS